MPGFEIIDHEEKKAVNKLFEEGGVLLAHGFEGIRKKYHVRDLEKNLSNYFNIKHCLAVSSGTAALKIALKALGVRRGDEVITQAFNFVATIEAIKDLEAKPVICNIDKTLNMDLVELESLITKKTKAIIPVHMLGMSSRTQGIIKLARKKGIKVLEDNCEAVGGKFDKKFLGTLSDIGVLSFDHAKMITSGEGGIIMTNNNKLIKYCREYHDHGHENNKKYSRGNDTKKIFGFNYRMTEIQAVIANVQLKKLSYMIRESKKRYKIIENNLIKSIPIRTPIKKSLPSYDCFILFCDKKSKLNKILKMLNNEGIGTKNLPNAIKWHCAFYWNHLLEKKQISSLSKTKNFLTNAIAIPIFLKKSQRKYLKITKAINSILEEKS